jgi:AcrR family transcriptional regulator
MKTSKRDLIIDSAVKVFAEKGYQYTTTQSIAREAGISKGLIHFYFENKLDLLLSIFLLFLQKINSINQEKLSCPGNPVDKLKSVFATFQDLLFQDKKSLYWGKLINERLPQADSIKNEALQKKRRAIVNENKKLVNCIDELIQDGQRKGMITTALKPQVLRQIFGGSSQMLTWRMYLPAAPNGHPEYDKDDVQSAMDTLIEKFTVKGGNK